MPYIVKLVTDQRLGMAIDLQVFTSSTFYKNKDGIMRMCIDFHTLNANTCVDWHHIPRIENFLD